MFTLSTNESWGECRALQYNIEALFTLEEPLSALQGGRQTHGSIVMFHGVLDSLCHVSDIKSVLDNCVESDGALWTRVIEQDRAGLLLVLCFSLACLK